ncbi:hypothetical protein CROQUDRAFT_653699 [Cronartium quercuum f. sp. fusiforme G11]|uniref:Uncharacterized protein n=1 Tax=Cronartium quercuum f. sp. fusiforme G11 TaxID=708437 RepID=A0A9P6NTT4_9BASI|nr:hypothetical protein CROQUDRAFT_653699 [Cronartium quercuum f. sp. fusiforme G11]
MSSQSSKSQVNQPDQSSGFRVGYPEFDSRWTTSEAYSRYPNMRTPASQPALSSRKNTWAQVSCQSSLFRGDTESSISSSSYQEFGGPLGQLAAAGKRVGYRSGSPENVRYGRVLDRRGSFHAVDNPISASTAHVQQTAYDPRPRRSPFESSYGTDSGRSLKDGNVVGSHSNRGPLLGFYESYPTKSSSLVRRNR